MQIKFYKIIRGGAFGSPANISRSERRGSKSFGGFSSGYFYNDGFRVVMEGIKNEKEKI